MKLKDYLKKNCRSIQWLANQVGISRPAMSKIVNQKTSPTAENLLRIVRATKGEVSSIELLKPRKVKKSPEIP